MSTTVQAERVVEPWPLARRAVSGLAQPGGRVMLERALDAYPDALGFDPIIQSHFASLYDKLLEQNILKIIGPYQRIPMAKIAQEVGLGQAAVEAKLGQMIIDNILYGIIDQAGGFVQILKVIEKDDAYENAIKTLDNLESAVVGLYALYQKKI